MQRLVILWLTVGLLTRATHARHNITAALVALAPVLNNDQETALSMDGRNESSVLSVDWILLLVATAAQFLLVLHHRWIERNTNTYHDFHWETGKDSFLYVDTQSHYTSHIDEAFNWRLDDRANCLPLMRVVLRLEASTKRK